MMMVRRWAALVGVDTLVLSTWCTEARQVACTDIEPNSGRP